MVTVQTKMLIDEKMRKTVCGVSDRRNKDYLGDWLKDHTWCILVKNMLTFF